MPRSPDEGLRHSADAVRGWLGLLVALVFGMVVVGGITRLTGSGLSMVEWAPIMGAIPPLDDAGWQDAFTKYQQTPQYRLANAGMTLAAFKGIFFWEYLHRLLARSVGVVFLLPFLWFQARGCFTPRFALRLLVALGLGGLQGLVGWLMVKSGLVNEPRVSHYRLAAHLGLAFLIMGYLWWLLLGLRHRERAAAPAATPRWLLWCIGLTALLQMLYGAFVAGLRAGWGYNTFPKMGDRWLAEAATALEPWWRNLLENPAAVQFVHRWLGTALLALVLVCWLRARAAPLAPSQRSALQLLVALVLLQYFLGLYTLLNAVPIAAAVMHQGCAAALLLAIVQLFFHNRPATYASG